MNVTDRIALDRLGLLTAPTGQTTPARAAAGVTELARVGVRITNPAAVSDALAFTVPDVVAHVRQRRGAHGVFAPLFAGFPDALPSFDDVRLRVLFGISRLAGRKDITDQDVRDAFDFTDIGWWPASSVPQDIPRSLSARQVQKRLAADGHVEWVDVRIVDAIERDKLLRAWMGEVFAAPAAPRADVLEDLRALVALFGVEHIDAATVRFRELRTLLTRVVWDQDPAAIGTLELTPDDILRLLADLTGSDLSLATAVRFPKLTRAQRRAVVAALESSPRLGDVFRRRSLWLAIARGLHVSDFDAPRTQDAFARLASSKHDATSLGSRFERALGEDYVAAVEMLAAEAPGALARQLRRLAALAVDESGVDALLRAVRRCGAQVPARVLLAVRAQIHDNGATYPRAAVTKAGAVLRIDRQPGHLAVGDDVRTQLLDALDGAAAAALGTKSSWQGRTVYVDPAAGDVLVPDGLRSTFPGLIEVERGTRIGAGDGAAVRLFVHWKHAVSDLDLSAIVFDDELRFVDQVSYTNLRAASMVHSGDLTSAPAGAQEFIDIDLAAARELATSRSWRYIAPVIFRYSGVTFDELEEAAAGWMIRENVSRDRMVFDPATVSNAFPLAGAARTAIPFVLDVVTGQIVYVNFYSRGGLYAAVERESATVGELVKATLERRNIKASVADLVAVNVRARGGELVDDVELADLSVGLGPQFTYDALRPASLLADLL